MVDAVGIIEAESRKYPGDDRPIFIGQAPSRFGDPRRPLTGRVGVRLAGLASMVPMEFYLSTVRVNLMPRYAGSDGQGDAFPMADARRRAVELVPSLDRRVVVFVGRKVAGAFAVGHRPWFVWQRDYIVVVGGKVVDVRYATIPHPSGRSRYWNDPQNIQEAHAFMAALMKNESAVPLLRVLRARARCCATNSSVRGALSSDSGADRLQEHNRVEGQAGPR